MSSRERIPSYKLYYKQVIIHRLWGGVGGEGFGDHLIFHRERRGREAIVANGVYGGGTLEN